MGDGSSTKITNTEDHTDAVTAAEEGHELRTSEPDAKNLTLTDRKKQANC